MHDLMNDKVLYVHITRDLWLFGQLVVCLSQHIMLIASSTVLIRIRSKPQTITESKKYCVLIDVSKTTMVSAGVISVCWTIYFTSVYCCEHCWVSATSSGFINFSQTQRCFCGWILSYEASRKKNTGRASFYKYDTHHLRYERNATHYFSSIPIEVNQCLLNQKLAGEFCRVDGFFLLWSSFP